MAKAMLLGYNEALGLFVGHISDSSWSSLGGLGLCFVQSSSLRSTKIGFIKQVPGSPSRSPSGFKNIPAGRQRTPTSTEGIGRRWVRFLLHLIMSWLLYCIYYCLVISASLQSSDCCTSGGDSVRAVAGGGPWSFPCLQVVNLIYINFPG